MLLILAAPLIFVYLFLRLSQTAFEMVGFSHWDATLAVFGCVIGSLFDYHLSAGPISAYPAWYISLVNLNPDAIQATFHPLYIAVNLGGCIIPLVISAHLLLRRQMSIGKVVAGIAIVAGVTYYAAETIPGEGITLPFWLSPLLAAVLGLIISKGYRLAPPLAYISGTLGTLLGADILSLITPGVLPALSPLDLAKARPIVLSIGGAGVFDGIFLTGIIAVLLASGIVCLFRGSCKEDD